ncbi:MAG: choice-of-anchor A family protein [Lachnospiraceae bacterium]|nr:choice-of-anchor A family protein [Lachnospiraceae bacterium]
MRKKKKLGALLLSGLVASSMLLSSLGNVNANTTAYTNVPTPTTYQYDSSDPLYAATHFHFFGKKRVEIRAHCHGNVATDVFSAGANSGSNKLGDLVKSEVFYFRKADADSGFIADFAGATVYLGAESNAQIMNNTEISFKLSDGSYKKIEPNSTVYTEASTTDRFIDFDAEFDKLNALSAHLATLSPTTVNIPSDAGIDVSSTNVNYTIDLSGQTDTTAYINIDGGNLNGGGDFTIQNIDDFKNGESLVINYEIPKDRTSYTVPYTKIIITDATGQLNSKENWGDYTGHGNILWNFYTRDAGNNIVPYTGELTTCDLFKGTVLAPSATVRLSNSNQDGNFIGTKIYGGGGQTHRWDFGGYLPRPTASPNPTPTGAIEVIVVEKGSNTPISNVTINVSNSNPDATLTTGANGKTSVLTGIPLNTAVDVTLTTPDGYEVPATPTITKNLTSTATVQVKFELEKNAVTPTPTPTGSLRVWVVDAKTLDEIEDVTVSLKKPDGTSTSLTTGTDGYTPTATGLTIRTNSTDVHTVTVTDVPDGYVVPTTSKTQAITNSSLQTVVIYLQKEATGSIQATIEDDLYDCSIPGTQIKISDETGVITTLTTNANGETTVLSGLKLDKTYTVEVISIPDGNDPAPSTSTHEHPLPAKKTVTLTSTNPDVVVPFVTSPPPNGALQVLVTDRFANEPINGATVEIYNVDASGNADVLIDTCVTDASGYTDVIKNLAINEDVNDSTGKYIIKVTSVPAGYTAPLDETVTITEKYTSETTIKKAELKIHQTGSAQATIVDEKTGALIQGATGTLTVTQVAVDGTPTTTDIPFTTDANGKTQKIDNLMVGSTVTVKVATVPDKYNKPADDTIPVTNPAPDVNEKTLKVKKKTGSLQATIIDETTGKPIPGADIVVKDKDNKEVYSGKTDENGQTAVIPGLTVDEIFTIITEAVPDGYTPPANKDVPITKIDPEVTTETLTVKPATEDEKKGSLQATIIDKNTKDPIKDATVEIKDSTGKVIATSKTDEKGKTTVITGLTINNTYTVHTSTVPDGYEAPDDTPVKITSSDLTSVDLTVEKETGSLQAVITDKNTGNPIANATVEIKDEKGTVIATVKTDENGLTPIVKDLAIGTTYTVHVTSVPNGYTAPDDRQQLISNSTLVTVKLVVSKATDTSIYTGDDTNVLGLSILAFISLAGIAVLTLKKKEFLSL